MTITPDPGPTAEQALWVSPTVRVVRAVETVFDVTSDQLRGFNRSDRYAAARAAAAWCGRQMGITTPRLGEALNKESSGVSKTATRAATRRGRDPLFARCCDEVLRRAREGAVE